MVLVDEINKIGGIIMDEIKDNGVELMPSGFNSYYEGAPLYKYIFSDSEEPKEAQVISEFDSSCFTRIPLPDEEYQASTTRIDISGLVDFNNYTSITDGIQTVTFSSPLNKRTVPSSWQTWSSPPFSEDSTPDVLFNDGNFSLTITLSVPSCTFGFELEPEPFAIFPYTVSFYSGTTLVGSIFMDVNGDAGARLFAARTCCCTVFDRVEITGGADFAIAQVRYGTCPTEGNCCCETSTPVTFNACQDSATLPVNITDIGCRGRLLTVNVTVRACERRQVAVGVFVCDNSTPQRVLRFKVSEVCMPPSTNADPCVTTNFRFCFIFNTDLCDPLSLNVRTIAEYACFDTPCNC